MSRFGTRRTFAIVTLSALSILLVTSTAWAGPATAWSQRTLNITMATCRTLTYNALKAAGYDDIQRDETAVASSDGPVSAWLICYEISSRRTLVTVFTAGEDYDTVTRMRNRLRDYVVSRS